MSQNVKSDNQKKTIQFQESSSSSSESEDSSDHESFASKRQSLKKKREVTYYYISNINISLNKSLTYHFIRYRNLLILLTQNFQMRK